MSQLSHVWYMGYADVIPRSFWSSHVEVVEVAVEEAPEGGRPGPEPQAPAQIFRTRRRFYRVQWEKLEHHWRLCGEPWPRLAARGWGLFFLGIGKTIIWFEILLLHTFFE